VTGKLGLAAFQAPIQARGSDPGRASTDPPLLVALWLFAWQNGIGNGRELDRLCRESRRAGTLRGGAAEGLTHASASARRKWTRKRKPTATRPSSALPPSGFASHAARDVANGCEPRGERVKHAIRSQALWLSQDDRWNRYWSARRAYPNAA